MGYVKKEFATEGTDIQISTGRKNLRAKVAKVPFYKV
jgi:glycine cleavage system aminomethyltransferase T